MHGVFHPTSALQYAVVAGMDNCCLVGLIPCFLQAKKDAELAEAPGTTTMDDLPAPPGDGAAPAGGGGGGTASRDVAIKFTGDTIPYSELKG